MKIKFDETETIEMDKKTSKFFVWQRGGDYGRETTFEKERRWKIWPKQLHAGDQVGEREHQVVHLRIFFIKMSDICC